MRYVSCILALSFLAGSCGDDRPKPDDLAYSQDLSAAAPMDLTVPPDLPPPTCLPLKIGLYNENVAYSYTPIGGGPPPMFVTSTTTAALRGDGVLLRPAGPPPDPSKFHCSFTLADIDPKTCLAPCCPGQTTSPLIFVSSGGWVLWTNGTCVFSTLSTLQYAAAIFGIDGYFNR